MFTRSIRFDDEVYDTYTQAANARGVSFNWLVHKVLEESMDKLKDPDKFTVLV